jgi:hypothetical protein
MQAEAGQPLEAIIARKDLERRAGGGLFVWGVGNSLRPRIQDLVRQVSAPEVFLSPMRSSPKAVDRSPDTIFCWTEYLDLHGVKHELPSHALVLSRGDTPKGVKTKHYGLVCHSEATLSLERLGMLNVGHCRNWQSSNPRVGASQVSAVLEHQRADHTSMTYEIAIRTTLVAPYFITLVSPLRVIPELKQALDDFVKTCPSSDAWLSFSSDFRHACRPV